MLFLRLNK
jgi:hypothetical protein